MPQYLMMLMLSVDGSIYSRGVSFDIEHVGVCLSDGLLHQVGVPHVDLALELVRLPYELKNCDAARHSHSRQQDHKDTSNIVQTQLTGHLL